MKHFLKFFVAAICIFAISTRASAGSPLPSPPPPALLKGALSQSADSFEEEEERNSAQPIFAAEKTSQINLSAVYGALTFGRGSNQVTLLGWGVYNLAGALKNYRCRRRQRNRLRVACIARGLALISLSAVIPDIFNQLYVSAFNTCMEF